MGPDEDEEPATFDRTPTGAVSPSGGVGHKVGRQRGNLRITEDGSVARTGVEDKESLEARIRANSGWDKSRMSGNTTADMAMAATVGDNPDEPELVNKNIEAVKGGEVAPPKAPSSQRARLVPRTYTAGFGKGLEIDTYSGDHLKEIEEDEARAEEEPLVL